ncbi:MAG: hypothetical protein JNK05_17395 [Myxococcales bacterium]|nr:hypothetical protein [Myxococcales bacterium]
MKWFNDRAWVQRATRANREGDRLRTVSSELRVALVVGALHAVSMGGCAPSEARCVPNETRVCACAGGRAGVQQCQSSGASYSVCDCSQAQDVAVNDATSDAMAPTDSGVVNGSDVVSVMDSAVGNDSGVPLIDCRSLPSSLPSGWVRGVPALFTEVPWIEIAGTFWNPFPNGGGTGRILTSRGEYLSLEFTTPTDVADWNMRAPNKRASWDRSQVGGEADVVYIGFSTCPGDFRLPPRDQVAPANDPTFARGCRSVRRAGAVADAPQSNIVYEISAAPSDESRCRLAPGRRYFLNVIRADVLDGAIGAPATEAGCVNPDLTRCGIQMRVD